MNELGYLQNQVPELRLSLHFLRILAVSISSSLNKQKEKRVKKHGLPLLSSDKRLQNRRAILGSLKKM